VNERVFLRDFRVGDRIDFRHAVVVRVKSKQLGSESQNDDAK
jgi:hypothetical protein